MTEERAKEIFDEQIELLVEESKKEHTAKEKESLANLICTLVDIRCRN